MKAKWSVRLVKKPMIFDWKSDYFPRAFYYKKDAQRLVDEVKRKGGEAVIDRK
jgi:hypothetical protein